MADQREAVIQNANVPEGATRELHGSDEPVDSPAQRSMGEPTDMQEPFITPEVPGIDLGPFVIHQPLADHHTVPAAIARLVSEADRDIARGRLESALDLTLAAQSEQPDCFGLYVRQAELLLATGRSDSAMTMAAAIASITGTLGGPSVEVDTERIRTHAQPTDENVLRFAHTVLNTRRTDLIDHYLPIAVDAASLQADPSLALNLARRWLETRPDNIDAAFSVTRESLRTGNESYLGELLERLPAESRDPESLVVKLVLHCRRGDADQWEIAANVLSAIEARQTDTRHVQALLREMIAVQRANESLLVHSGVLEINAGNPDAAFQLLSAIRPADPMAYYVSLVSCARAALASGNVGAAVDSLRRAMELHRKSEIAAFARSCPVLRPPYDMFSIGKATGGALQQRGDIAECASLLEQLSGLNPGREDLSRAYADALAKSGKRETAIARLEGMLRQHEEAGDRAGIVLTIQSILQISPGNLRLRNRLIDEYMKRGQLLEAVQERWTLAQILERAERVDDAIDQLRRASDVASVLGDWKKLESIIRKMIQLRPNDFDVRHSAATKFIEYGQIQLAIEQLWGVVDIAERSNDPDEAIAALHQIIALGPQEVSAYHKLGEVLASVGEFAQAERVYRRLATLAPDDPAVQAKQSALAAMARGGG